MSGPAADAAGFPLAVGGAVLLDESACGHAAGVVSSASPDGRAVVAVCDRAAWTRPLGIEVDAARDAWLSAWQPRGRGLAGLAERRARLEAAFAEAGELAYAGDAEASEAALRALRPDLEGLAADFVALACSAEVALAEQERNGKFPRENRETDGRA